MNPSRRAHADPRRGDPVAHDAFEQVSVDARWIEVDTTDGYSAARANLWTWQ
ncbi:MAG TPA: hypothetical protein VII22_27880 [Streptosporangiaceae bacterium]